MVELKRPSITKQVRDEMHEKYRRRYERFLPQDIRHIYPVEKLKTRIESRLNKLPRGEQIEALRAKGFNVRRNASDKSITGYAQQLLNWAANDHRNLFVDLSAENRRLRDQYDVREFKNKRLNVRKALVSHQAYMTRKYLPK